MMETWFVFKTSDKAGENLLSENQFDNQHSAKVCVFDYITKAGNAKITYTRNFVHETFEVESKNGEIFYIFIAGRYD